ncbi:MAG: hypothetical protein K2N63_10935 [Lachnospiraceae bacterium]|nr:hypothetical protein [Lachnospiraceae bacterium]
MEAGDPIMTQLGMLEKCLVCKGELLEKIYNETAQQEAILDTNPFSEEAFDRTLERKAEAIEKLTQYDQGFEQIFSRIRDEVMADKDRYRERIVNMQQLIGEVTKKAVHIQSLEQKNKVKLEIYFSNRRQQIKNFNVSSRTVSNYYKSMSSGGKADAFFMDKKQ